MQCREACGACCVAPSITRPFFGMPGGKPAGVACVHLAADRRCALFGDPRRPRPCLDFAPEPAICGVDRDQAMQRLAQRVPSKRIQVYNP